jgi:hypothetical protein
VKIFTHKEKTPPIEENKQSLGIINKKNINTRCNLIIA